MPHTFPLVYCWQKTFYLWAELAKLSLDFVLKSHAIFWRNSTCPKTRNIIFWEVWEVFSSHEKNWRISLPRHFPYTQKINAYVCAWGTIITEIRPLFTGDKTYRRCTILAFSAHRTLQNMTRLFRRKQRKKTVLDFAFRILDLPLKTYSNLDFTTQNHDFTALRTYRSW